MQTALDIAILRAKCARQTPQAIIERPQPPITIDIIEHGESVPVKAGVHPPKPWADNPSLHIVSRIIKAACHHFGLSHTEICGKSRQVHVAYPRQIVMFVSHKLGVGSYPAIGRRIDRDHTTVLSGCRKIERIQHEPHVAADIEAVTRLIGEVI